jgi:O-methyltransferase involved in polyketide biosynthesis
VIGLAGPRDRLAEVEPYDFRRVSQTALVPAFARGEYTTIPWAREILEILRSRGAPLSGSPWSELNARGYAPIFEARFRAVSRVLEEKGAAQVLELAAGLSPRGMELAPRGVEYVEADLPESIAMKRELVTAILGSIPERLHLCSASVIDRTQFLDCCAPFSPALPVAVTTEGLLRYLTFEEKTRVAANVLEVISRSGGWWITPDIHLRSWAERRNPAQVQRETETLGRSLESNYFTDFDHARQFFETCGFQVESRSLADGVAPQAATTQFDDSTLNLADFRLFVMSPIGGSDRRL